VGRERAWTDTARKFVGHALGRGDRAIALGQVGRHRAGRRGGVCSRGQGSHMPQVPVTGMWQVCDRARCFIGRRKETLDRIAAHASCALVMNMTT
jgi:hypothetical protein